MAQPDFKIEKNMPPPPDGHGGANRKYPFAQMEPGDSFFSPSGSVREAARGFAMRAGKGWKFATRKVEGGFRIWRIA